MGTLPVADVRVAGGWRRIPATALLVLLGLLSATSSQAQGFAGLEIREIEYQQLESLLEDSMNFYLGLEVGKSYNPAEVDDNIHKLWDRSLVDDVVVRAERLDGGVKLIILIKERPRIVAIEYEGLDKVKRNDIGDAVDKERIELYEGSDLRLGELVRLKQTIEELYAERGYRFAEVQLATTKAGPGERRIMITVDEGSKVKIGQVDFEGNEVFSSGRLGRSMKKTKETGILSNIRKRNIFNPVTVEEDLEVVRTLYKEMGYKDVETGEPVIEVIEGKQAESAKRRLRLIIPIEEGARWKLGEVLFEGNEILGDQILGSVFEQPKGGWLRSDVVDDGIEKISEFYNNAGYLFARIEKEVVEREDRVADILIKVEENDQFKVGRMEFSGNTRTRDRVLRREMRVQEGLIFNSGGLRNSLLKINQLEYFKLDEDDPVGLDYDSEGKTVDLVIKGDEAERTELQFGGGYSELDGFFAQTSIRTRNFLGRGETLAVSFQSGRFRDLLDVSYFRPWLLDRPQSVGLQIFDRDLDFDLLSDQVFRRKETGAVLTYGRSFRLFEGVSFAYTLSEFEDFQSQRFVTDPTMPEGMILSQGFNFEKSSISASYNFDSHNSRLEPTTGTRFSWSTEVAGGALGGQNQFVRNNLNFALTRPLRKKGLRTVGRLNLDAAYVEPFGTDRETGLDQELFFLDRVLLGGENSVRGYRFRSIWVRDPETGATIRDTNGFPVGGNSALYLNLEHHFVVNGPFRIILYADAGGVFDSSLGVDPSFDALRAVAGIELRINVPLFGAPLRFIWANQLNPFDDLNFGDEERFDSFDFSIGVSF